MLGRRGARASAERTRPESQTTEGHLTSDLLRVTGTSFTRNGYKIDQTQSEDDPTMTYKSSFQDRAGQAAAARAKALEQYRVRPQLDPKEAAERAAAGRERAEARARKTADRKAEKQASAEARAADDAANATASAPRSEAELKAARDAKYAARKARRK